MTEDERNTRRRPVDVAFRMNSSLVDMEDIGCPGEWINDMSAGIEEIFRLRTALRRIADEPFSDVGSIRSFVCSVLIPR